MAEEIRQTADSPTSQEPIGFVVDGDKPLPLTNTSLPVPVELVDFAPGHRILNLEQAKPPRLGGLEF
jgi:hypothetical protein